VVLPKNRIQLAARAVCVLSGMRFGGHFWFFGPGLVVGVCRYSCCIYSIWDVCWRPFLIVWVWVRSAFVVFHAVSILSRVFANLSVPAGFAPVYVVNYLPLMSCSRPRCFRASRDCSHVCRAVCRLSAVCCFRPPCVGVCGHAVRVAFLLSHGPHARFRALKFLTRPTRAPRTPRRGCVCKPKP
jgi:hypothetical protein